MYTIQIWIRCPGRFCEVLPEEMERTELAVEALVSHVLLELFEMVTVENVTVRWVPMEQDGREMFLQSA